GAGGYDVKIIRPRELARLVERLERYQAIILDEQIAGRPAFELLIHLKARPETSEIPVCVLCSDCSEFTAAAYFGASVDRVVDKKDVPGIEALELLLKPGWVPDVLPLIPLRDAVLFPGMTMPLF